MCQNTETVETETTTMNFAGFGTLADLLYSQLLPGVVALSGFLLFTNLFIKDLLVFIYCNLSEFPITVLGFVASIILGNIFDGIRHCLFDKFQRKYGNNWQLWRSGPPNSEYLDPICVLVGKTGSGMDKQKLREWLRVNLYLPGEFMGNLALTLPFLFLGIMANLVLYFSVPIIWAGLIFILLGLLLSSFISLFIFKVSSVYITNYEYDITALTSDKKG